jgi:hypothetical protein
LESRWKILLTTTAYSSTYVTKSKFQELKGGGGGGLKDYTVKANALNAQKRKGKKKSF